MGLAQVAHDGIGAPWPWWELSQGENNPCQLQKGAETPLARAEALAKWNGSGMPCWWERVYSGGLSPAGAQGRLDLALL